VSDKSYDAAEDERCWRIGMASPDRSKRGHTVILRSYEDANELAKRLQRYDPGLWRYWPELAIETQCPPISSRSAA
jgi:hypothetical protein